jgi:hypothetical protein
VRQAAAHAWVDGKDAFHFDTFLNTASSSLIRLFC